MKRRPLILALLTVALVVVATVSPAVAQAGAQTGPIDYRVAAWIGSALGDDHDPPGPDITFGFTIPSEYGGGGYARDPRVGDTMDLYYGWLSYTLGLTRSAPGYTVLALWVDGPRDFTDIVITTQDAQAYWGSPSPVSTDVPPFNPAIGATAWKIDWDYLFALSAPGTYYVHFLQEFSHATTDLTAIANPYYDPDDPDSAPFLDKFAGHTTYEPGDGVRDSYFTFQVKH